MLGVSLSFYKENLKFVPVHQNSKPMNSFLLESVVKEEAKQYIEDYMDPDKPFEETINRLPLSMYDATLEQLSKIRLSSIFTMCKTVEDLFRENPKYRIVYKIQSSMWRWGHREAQWNELVHAYNSIRRFSLDREGFSVRLDYTTSVNKCGNSEYSRTYLDGVFAYLVYYKGRHVMTLGFSIVAGKKLLIQQIQLKQPHGNRWLFKLPPNYTEYVIRCFEKAFPNYRLYIVEGASLVDKYLEDYMDHYKYADNKCASHSDRAEKRDVYDLYNRERNYYRDKILHVKNDTGRISRLYNNTGSYEKLNKPPLRLNGMNHYQIDKPEKQCYSSTLVNTKVSHEPSFCTP